MLVCLGVNQRFEFHLEEGQIHKQQEYARRTTGWNRETRVNQIDHIFSYRGEKGRSRIHQLGEGQDWISGISDHLPVSSII